MIKPSIDFLPGDRVDSEWLASLANQAATLTDEHQEDASELSNAIVHHPNTSVFAIDNASRTLVGHAVLEELLPEIIHIPRLVVMEKQRGIGIGTQFVENICGFAGYWFGDSGVSTGLVTTTTPIPLHWAFSENGFRAHGSVTKPTENGTDTVHLCLSKLVDALHD